MSDAVASPCISLCRLDDDDICQGCFRHLSEIRDWGRRPDAEKRQILALVRERRCQAAGL